MAVLPTPTAAVLPTPQRTTMVLPTPSADLAVPPTTYALHMRRYVIAVCFVQLVCTIGRAAVGDIMGALCMGLVGEDRGQRMGQELVGDIVGGQCCVSWGWWRFFFHFESILTQLLPQWSQRGPNRPIIARLDFSPGRSRTWHTSSLSLTR